MLENSQGGIFLQKQTLLFQRQLFQCQNRRSRGGSREENAEGTKIVKVPTASETSKIFTDHTFLGSKLDKTV